MPSHTAAPWLNAAKPSSIVGWPVVGPGGRLICDIAWQPKPEHVDAKAYDAFYRECQANACLIAAGPEMLSALKMAVLRIERPDLSPDANVVTEHIRAAIAKATGAVK